MLPKFSIRQMMLAMIVVAAVAAFLAGASRGSQLSLGFAVGILGTVIPFAFFTIVFWLSLGLAQVTSRYGFGVKQDEPDTPPAVGAGAVGVSLDDELTPLDELPEESFSSEDAGKSDEESEDG